MYLLQYNHIKYIWNKFLDQLYPPKCLYCGADSLEPGKLCADCIYKIKYISNPYCKRCGLPFEFSLDEDFACGRCLSKDPSFTKIEALFSYDSFSKKIIHNYKFNKNPRMAPILAEWMLNMKQQYIKHNHIITAIPLHRLRFLRRGYNQSALLALYISKHTGLKFIPDLAVRKKNTKPQFGLNIDQRKQNVKNIFKSSKKFANIVKDKNVLVIDDVVTTGATVEEFCKTLNKFGPNEINVLALARTSNDARD